ncbi:MAG: endopeptidase La, partial [Solobacterium sp.]|nr:endopeptidase La [Solobacterium sp.]
MSVIIPIYRSLVLPDSRMNLQNDLYRKAAGRDPETGERAIFVMAKKEKEPGEYTSDDFWPIGVSGTVRDVSSSGFAMFNMESRVDVESMRMGPDGVLEANTVIRRPDIDDLPFEEEKKKLDGLKGAILKMTESYQWGTMARGWIMQWRSVSEVMTVISQWLNLTSREKYSILEEDSKRKRVEMMEKILYEYIEITTLTNEATSEQEETTQKLYREQAIKKQLEYLQRQLDEMHPENV